MPIERRIGKRFNVSWPAKATDLNGVTIEDGVLRNISSGGAMVDISTGFQVGDQVVLYIKLPFKNDNWMAYNSVVVGIEPSRKTGGIALKFNARSAFVALTSIEILDAQRNRLIYDTEVNLSSSEDTQLAGALIGPSPVLISVHQDFIRMIAEDPDLLYKIPPRTFEEVIAEIFSSNGYEVELTKATRDGGKDIVAIYNNMNIRTKYIIECKRYARDNKVSVDIIQRLLGVKFSETANKAILATTSTFTEDARGFAIKHTWDLELKEYNDIVAWLKAYKSKFW